MAFLKPARDKRSNGDDLNAYLTTVKGMTSKQLDKGLGGDTRITANKWLKTEIDVVRNSSPEIQPPYSVSQSQDKHRLDSKVLTNLKMENDLSSSEECILRQLKNSTDETSMESSKLIKGGRTRLNSNLFISELQSESDPLSMNETSSFEDHSYNILQNNNILSLKDLESVPNTNNDTINSSPSNKGLSLTDSIDPSNTSLDYRGTLFNHVHVVSDFETDHGNESDDKNGSVDDLKKSVPMILSQSNSVVSEEYDYSVEYGSDEFESDIEEEQEEEDNVLSDRRDIGDNISDNETVCSEETEIGINQDSSLLKNVQWQPNHLKTSKATQTESVMHSNTLDQQYSGVCRDHLSNNSGQQYSGVCRDCLSNNSGQQYSGVCRDHLSNNSGQQYSGVCRDHLSNSAVSTDHLHTTPILPYVVNTEELEALTAYSPAIVALQDLVSSQVALTRHLIQQSRSLSENLINDLSPDYHYMTLDSTREYIANHRPKVLSHKEALRCVKRKEHLW